MQPQFWLLLSFRPTRSVAEAILPDDKQHVVGSPLIHLWGFNHTRASLSFETFGVILPYHLTVEQIILLFHGEADLSPFQVHSLLGILKHHNIRVLGDLWDNRSGWRYVASFCESTCTTRQGDDPGLIWLLWHIGRVREPNFGFSLQDCNGWCQRASNKLIRSWAFPNKIWRIILSTPHSKFIKLNARWSANLASTDWICFWKMVWGSMTFYRVCIRRVMNHGYFHHLQAWIWRVHSSLYPCNSQPESIIHMFYECWNLRRRWATLAVVFVGSPFAPVFCQDTLWGIIHFGALRARRSPIPLVIIVDLLHDIWTEQNAIRYRGDQSQLPIRQLLYHSLTHVKALIEICKSDKKKRRWELELCYLELAANPPLFYKNPNDQL